MTRRPSIQLMALVAGATYLLVGLLGFVPGATTHYGELGFAGHTSRAQLFGVFQVSILANLLHVAFGVVGVALARARDTARTFLVGGGAVYLALWLIGVVGAGGWIPVDTADNWLHFAFGIGAIALGYVGGPETAPTAAS